MMDIEQLKSLAMQSESETVEFKTSTAEIRAAFLGLYMNLG
jgi:hypothetical protein